MNSNANRMHPSTRKVIAAAREAGLAIEVVEFAESTRTAEEAAAAVGCDVAQIVKSLCFTAAGRPVMAFVSGANQLDERKLAELCGVSRKKIGRASPDLVKEATGYTIGGVAPFGHTSAMPIFIDADLMAYNTIWAAAGTPNAVFPIQPADLQRASAGQVADLKREP